jgi:hypothetical protein
MRRAFAPGAETFILDARPSPRKAGWTDQGHSQVCSAGEGPGEGFVYTGETLE